MELTPMERDLLRFEREWWQSPGPKTAMIRGEFGLSTSSYYRVLRALVDRPEALEHDPLTVKRL